MEKYYVYRTGSNGANQSMTVGPVLVAEVEAESESEACDLAGQRVTVYNNQYLSAELLETVDTREAGIDERVTVVE